MLYLTFSNRNNLNILSDLPNIKEKIKEPAFSVKDSPLSYRQINTLTKDNVLIEKRKNSKEWRKFSIYDLVFLYIVKQLKDFGITNKKLSDIRNLFYHNREAIDVITLAILGEKIMLKVSDVNIELCDWNYLDILSKYENAYLSLNISEIAKTIKQDKPNYIFENFVGNLNRKLSNKEDELINAIRNKDYKEIRIKKDSEGKVKSVYAEKIYSDKVYSEKEVIDIIRSKEWAKFEITKTNGNIVSIKDIEIFK